MPIFHLDFLLSSLVKVCLPTYFQLSYLLRSTYFMCMACISDVLGIWFPSTSPRWPRRGLSSSSPRLSLLAASVTPISRLDDAHGWSCHLHQLSLSYTIIDYPNQQMIKYPWLFDWAVTPIINSWKNYR